MAILEKLAASGPVDRHIRDGGEALCYETSALLGNAGLFNTPDSSLLENLDGVAPAADDWIRRGSIGEILLTALADEVSGTNGVVIQESMDGANPIVPNLFQGTTVADALLSQLQIITAPFFRVSYLNAATPQTSFFLRVVGRVTRGL